MDNDISRLIGTPPEGTPPLSCSELVSLVLTRSERAWEAAVGAIKASRGGQWPPDWFRLVMASGFAWVVRSTWGTDVRP